MLLYTYEVNTFTTSRGKFIGNDGKDSNFM